MKERHVWMHSQPYRPCSLATLRDPCERISSIFRHLKERYPQRSTTQHYCKYLTLNGTPGTPACTTHWLHNAINISTFVALLAEHGGAASLAWRWLRVEAEAPPSSTPTAVAGTRVLVITVRTLRRG